MNHRTKKDFIICFILMFTVLFMINGSEKCHALPITSDFGWRSDPFSGELRFHTGIDLAYEYGTGIPALFDGIVITAGDRNDGYGNQVLLYHKSIESYTRYGHCADIFVTAGVVVSQGQIIASVGSTGNSTGPHLHLEYIIKGLDGYEYTNPAVLWN